VKKAEKTISIVKLLTMADSTSRCNFGILSYIISSDCAEATVLTGGFDSCLAQPPSVTAVTCIHSAIQVAEQGQIFHLTAPKPPFSHRWLRLVPRSATIGSFLAQPPGLFFISSLILLRSFKTLFAHLEYSWSSFKSPFINASFFSCSIPALVSPCKRPCRSCYIPPNISVLQVIYFEYSLLLALIDAVPIVTPNL